MIVDDGVGKQSRDGVLVTVLAGPSDSPGEESFHVDVVTLDALARMLDAAPFLVGRHLLIARDLNIESAKEFLRRRFEEPEADTWPELASKLARIGLWEFEDYLDPRG